MKTPDIDLDFGDRSAALAGLRSIAATRIGEDGHDAAHPTGVYFQAIPAHPVTGQATIDYRSAGELGYFKVDFLNLEVYKRVRHRAHLDELMQRPVQWEFLSEPAFVAMLFQIGNHFDVVDKIKPTSIQDLAMVIALIRPGKRHLLKEPVEFIRREIWAPVDGDYVYRKSHAIAYAHVVVLDMALRWEAIEAQLEAAAVAETESDDLF